MDCPLEFPPSFILQNLCDITGRVFELKRNPDIEEANKSMLEWFSQFVLYDPKTTHKFIHQGRFDIFAEFSFPDADLTHLETCLMFFFYAFAVDDLSDEGELQRRPDEVESGHAIQRSVLYDVDAEEPEYPYAAMLVQSSDFAAPSLLRRMRTTATQGCIDRFIKAYLKHSGAQVQQSHNRSVERFPSVEEFILMRRATIGSDLVKAVVEYSIDLDLPEYVFDDPIMLAMADATNDIMTWPNDLCSFNKEQADGDYQNLVVILMVQHDVDLQTAVDMLTDMVAQRVKEYELLKTQLPSWGPKVDAEVAKYNKAVEHLVQGCVVWYYHSP
ncbi:terpenoid synthase, partial [Atractiella rhizophila]